MVQYSKAELSPLPIIESSLLTSVTSLDISLIVAYEFQTSYLSLSYIIMNLSTVKGFMSKSIVFAYTHGLSISE